MIARRPWQLRLALSALCVLQLASCSPQKQVAPSPSALALLEQTISRVVYPVPVPEITHHKEPGKGYSEGSPLFKRQEAWLRHRARAERKAHAVSTTISCIVNLATQFFVVYALLFTLQSLNRINQRVQHSFFRLEIQEQCMAKVANTVVFTPTMFFVPMLCVLFLATRMRAVQLSQGEPETYELPQWWVKVAMRVCTWSVLLITLVALATGAAESRDAEAWLRNRRAGRALLAIRSGLLLTIYAAFTVVIIGLLAMKAPSELWGLAGGPKVSPAIFCTIALAVGYFAVFLAKAISEILNEFQALGETRRFHPAVEWLKRVTMKFAFAPMLCVLFIAARLRAMQLNMASSDVQTWVQASFFICSLSVFLQALLELFDFDTTQGQEKKVEVLNGSELKPKDVLRYMATAFMFIGVAVIITGVFLMQPVHGSGGAAGPATLLCVSTLTVAYFGVYLWVWFLAVVTHRLGPGVRHSKDHFIAKLYQLLGDGAKAKEAVNFCPMLCILFLAALLQALQMSAGMGSSQQWCEIFMFIATGSILVSVLTGRDFLSMPGAPLPKLAVVCSIVQYVCLFLLYLSAGGIVIALFTMTPEVTGGHG